MRFLSSTWMMLAVATGVLAQAPSVDTSRIGPQIGQPVPPIVGVDHFGKAQTLGSIYGPKGAMLVFFRSADW
jgi:hypothetical protein